METRLAVRDVMTRTVVTATPEMTAAQAGKKMVEKRVGSIIIVKNEKPVGIVTESDMVAKVIFKNVKPSSIKLDQLMSKPLITTKSSDDVHDAVLMMAQKKIRRLPVLDGDELVGIITDADVIQVSSEVNQILDNLIEMNKASVRSVKNTQMICSKREDASNVRGAEALPRPASARSVESFLTCSNMQTAALYANRVRRAFDDAQSNVTARDRT